MPGRHGFECMRAQPRPTSRDRKARVGLLAVALIPLVLLASGCLEPREETQNAIVFELEPRALATGRHRDPQLAVRASGAIALALVAPGERGIADLDLYLSSISPTPGATYSRSGCASIANRAAYRATQRDRPSS